MSCDFLPLSGLADVAAGAVMPDEVGGFERPIVAMVPANGCTSRGR